MEWSLPGQDPGQEGLYFPRGVALSHDESFVLVSETSRYRITRYWIAGPRAGTTDIFLDNLPGFPGNLSRGSDGYWVSVVAARNAAIDWLHPNPYLKGVVSKLPELFWPMPERCGLVLAISEDPRSSEQPGRIVLTLHDHSGEYLRGITSVKEVRGQLYLSAEESHTIGRLR